MLKVFCAAAFITDFLRSDRIKSVSVFKSVSIATLKLLFYKCEMLACSDMALVLT